MANPSDGRRRRRDTLQLRLTIVATAVAAIPLVAAAITLAASLRTQLYRNAVDDARGECVVIETLKLPNELPWRRWLAGGPGCDVVGLVPGNSPQSLMRIPPDVDPSLFSSLPMGTTENLEEPGENFVVRSDDAGLSLWPETATPSIVVSRRIDLGPSGETIGLYPLEPGTIGMGPLFRPDGFVTWSHSLGREQGTLNMAMLALAAGALLAIGLVGATTWVMVGRVVRPVEAIRRRVAEITTENLGDRVPVPRARTEIARLAETMNDTLARLDHAVSEQRRFVADASHELRGPIAALRSELEIAHTHPDQARWPEVVAGALEDTERLQDLASDLLLLSRLDAKPPELDETVDLVALAREEGSLRRFRGQLTLHYDLAAEEVTVQGRHALLARVVRNLLDNAERHAASSIMLRVAVEGSSAVLEVVDDGPGVPHADRERIFDRFTRLDQARARDTGGVGLGLAIARHIAVIHGGTLSVTDSEHGARFTAVLTRAEHR